MRKIRKKMRYRVELSWKGDLFCVYIETEHGIKKLSHERIKVGEAIIDLPGDITRIIVDSE